MVYPAKYPPVVTPQNWNAMVDFFNGFSPSGNFVAPFAFIIYTNTIDGTTYYYANNAFQLIYGGPDGKGKVDGTDASAVTQAAVDAAAWGSKIYMKTGNYASWPSSVEIDKYLAIEGDSITYGAGTKISSSADIPLFKISDRLVTLKNMYLATTADPYTNNLIEIDSTSKSLYQCYLEKLAIYRNPTLGFEGNAISINASANYIMFLTIQDCWLYGGFENMIAMTTGGAGKFANSITVNHVYLENFKNGIVMDENGGATNRNNFVDVQAQAGASTLKGIVVDGDRNLIRDYQGYDFPVGSVDIHVLATADMTGIFGGTKSKAFTLEGTNTKIRDVNYFVTENSGTTGAIATGTAVNHGLAGTPTSVTVTAAESGPTDIYVDTVGATSFKINFGGGGNKTFYWKAEYQP